MRFVILMLTLCSSACGQEWHFHVETVQTNRVVEIVTPVENASQPEASFHVVFYTATWCKNCPTFKKSEAFKNIDQAYAITTLDFDSCDAAFKKDIKYLPAVRLVDSKTLKTVKQLHWPETIDLASLKAAERDYEAGDTAPTVAKPVVSVPAKPVTHRMSFQELIRAHNRAHCGNPNQQWTWPSGTEESLRRHLETVHGVNTD